MQEFKQVIVVRTDLKMGKGKTAVQVAHASVLGVEEARRRFSDWQREWKIGGQAKIAVKINSLENLFSVRKKAEGKNLPVVTVQDSGLTQLPNGTVTCISIGPGPSHLIDVVTKDLKLL